MANRSYLYSLDNRPASYADRPEKISGLSEWPYAVPFSYRVLMSGDPALCASLVSDGFEDDTPDNPTKLYAISAEFDAGYARLRKFFSLVPSDSTALRDAIAETVRFLDEHRDRYLLLETIELDSMVESDAAGMRAAVEREIEVCRQVGAAIDALPEDATGAWLAKDAAFQGLVLTDDFDNTRDDRTEYPLGLSWWTDVLYFALWNRAEFEAGQSQE